MESHIRSIAKAITWRTGGTIVTFLVAWLCTGQLQTAGLIGLVDTVVKVGAFYAHERLWNRIALGRQKEPEYYL